MPPGLDINTHACHFQRYLNCRGDPQRLEQHDGHISFSIFVFGISFEAIRRVQTYPSAAFCCYDWCSQGLQDQNREKFKSTEFRSCPTENVQYVLFQILIHPMKLKVAELWEYVVISDQFVIHWSLLFINIKSAFVFNSTLLSDRHR